MTVTLHPSIVDIDMPKRMQQLPLNAAGFPIPWFVAYVNGEPEFRMADSDKFARSIRERRCWLCGNQIPAISVAAFVVGPMCGVNRVSSEPPSHTDCAVYAAKACPFLANPTRARRETDMPDEYSGPGGTMIERNPGVTLVWVTNQWELFQANGPLFHFGEPSRTMWFRERRPATRSEVLDAIESGLPALEATIDIEANPDEAAAALASQIANLERFLPAA